MPDDWETEHGLDPLDPSDASGDPDGDGVTNLQEFRNGSDPNVAEGLGSWVWLVVALPVIGGLAAGLVLRRRRASPPQKAKKTKEPESEVEPEEDEEMDPDEELDSEEDL